MALPWIRLDTSLFDHPKFLGLFSLHQHRSALVFVAGMAYAGKHGTDGFIPREALGLLQGRQSDARALIEAGLWAECAGGWDIHGWDDYQVSDEASKARRDKAKHAAAVRWSKREVKLQAVRK
jgi:hypothetical protein